MGLESWIKQLPKEKSVLVNTLGIGERVTGASFHVHTKLLASSNLGFVMIFCTEGLF